MYLLIKVFEFAARVAQEEFALDPDGEAEDIGEEQSAVKRDAFEIVVQDETAPWNQEAQLRAQPEAECKKDQRGDKNGVGDHRYPFRRDRGAAISAKAERRLPLRE